MKKTKNQECWIKFPEKANSVAAQTKTVESKTESTVLPVIEYSDEFLLRAIKILLKRCKHKQNDNALLDVIDNLCYYEDVFFGLPICENCKYAIMKNGEFEDCVKTLKQDAHYCRKVFLDLVAKGVIK